MFYCGKYVNDWDNHYKKNFTDGRCGPKTGPNCLQCRKKINPDLPTKNDEGREVWQGSSGRFYCGSFFQKQYPLHDGYCGPTNGIACKSCRRLLQY